MNEKSPQSRGNGDGSTVVVAVVLTVIVVLAAAILVGGVFVFFFAVPFSNVSRPGSPSAVTTTQNTVTIAQYEAKAGIPGKEPDRTDIQSVAEEPKHAVAPEEQSVSEASDVTLPADETVESDTMPPAKEETSKSRTYQSLPRAFERVGVRAGDGEAPASVAFSGRKCKSIIWAQPDEDRGVSQLSYMLDGKYATLRGTAGISDAASDEQPGDQKPSAVFRIYGDGNLLWESEPQNGFGAFQQFEIEVKGIDVLALTAESSSPSESSRFAWGDVELKVANE